MGVFFKIRSLYRAFRYTEIRYIECRLHGKLWETNRDRRFSFVIEKIRYMGIRSTERRL